MTSKAARFILKKYLAHSRQSQTAGITLLELLMAISITSIILYSMLSLVVSLLNTEKKETAKTQVQQEMSAAMDYIASELKEAVYIYNGNCISGADPSCVGLANAGVQIPAEVTPTLAFWKLKAIEMPGDGEGPFDPSSCTTDDCRNLLTTLNTYTLVVYGVEENNADIWEGPAQIRRFELPQYPSIEDAVDGTPSFDEDPRTTAFVGWNPSSINTDNTFQVLVDFVDRNRKLENQQPCPGNYVASPSSGANAQEPGNWNFYACVQPSGNGVMQDAIVFLRGNAAEKAGQDTNSVNPVYLPSIQRRVQARSVFNYDPSSRN
ncbi:hypothetical protein JJD41_23330 [Oxynema sp. CENA135]|uniref:hypothetical protein n=1 Tax=Oxynema sp. CENA135 TaxID=984206 RepID=UPI001A3CEECF|nr:hypothetical protein [Oxynema sp. CENA135]MBK4732776.1 hypothetical protein [Oxynema sp. CENA135]